jgi:hypothetical protein
MKRFSLLVALLVSAAAMTSFAQAPQTIGIPAANLNGQIRIIGLLGKPLGEKVTIAGKFKSIKLPNPLEVAMIDGKPLDKPVVVDVQGAKIKPGVNYTLIGYETGGYTSTPEWAADDPPAGIYEFSTWFVVVKVVEKK